MYEVKFSWQAPSEPAGTPAVPPRRLPDLVPAAPEGWEDSLVATSYRGVKEDGPLSISVPTYISYGLSQRKPRQLRGEVVGIPVSGRCSGVRSGGWGPARRADGRQRGVGRLFESVNLAPGVHTLRLEVDATNLIDEADETNNSVEKHFTWGQGPSPRWTGASTHAKPRPGASHAAQPGARLAAGLGRSCHGVA